MRSSNSEQAKRVNAAIALLRKHALRAKVVRAMMRRFRISRRQAYRYVHRAEEARQPMEIPEQKVVFTVKLPKSLAVRIRRFAGSSGRTLSAVVAQALEGFLRARRQHGRRQPPERG
jgi:predicted DNA-binding transcriptional regulator YafY